MPRKKQNGLDTQAQAKKRDDSRVTEGTTAGHNSAERAKIIQECATEMRTIKTARKDLNEQAGEIRQRIEDLGINVKAWEAGLRVADMDDEAARDSYIDSLRETYQALGIGETGEMFPARPQTETRTPTQKEARTAGREAGRAGKKADTNPHGDGTAAHAEWLTGWGEGQADIVKDMGGAGQHGADAEVATA